MRRILMLVIRLYQRTISPLLGPRCRFYPSCSQYAAEAIQKHGAAHGFALALARVARCHPWHPGGVDLVPDRVPPTIER
ncbi:MAG TPA: membrane protein insertion efficiency factor YidD [Candidatus Acidoferrales bacterium]|nr:membrane protein insertion efficiency factor YidD [Candidatus Acidoferrales bacterium]